MNKEGISFQSIKKSLFEDEAFKTEYDNLEARYQIISAIIQARIDQNITQQELATRVGTSKSSISRLESGTYNPSVEYLERIAKGLGSTLHIELRHNKK